MNLSQQHFEVVNCVRQYEGLQRQDISKILNVSFPTLKSLLDCKPLDGKNTDEQGFTPCCNYLSLDSAKSPITLKPDSAYFLGFSIGVGQIKICLLDMSFRCLMANEVLEIFERNNVNISNWKNYLTDEYPELHLNMGNYGFCFKTGSNLNEFCDVINGVLSCFVELISAGFYIASIGFSYPGAVDYKGNTSDFGGLDFIDKMTPSKLINPAIYDRLREANISISFEHDVKASIVSEKFAMYRTNSKLFYIKDKPNICCLYLGSGISTGIILNNSLFRGSNNYSGEIGHIQIPGYFVSQAGGKKEDPVETCRCGNSRCFELLFLKNVFGLSKAEFKNKSNQDLIEILDKEKQRDLFSDYICFIINLVVNVFDLDAVILTGRLSEIVRAESVWRMLCEKTNKNAIGYFPNCIIEPSTYDRFTPAIGAAICSYYSRHNNPISWYSQIL